MTDEERQAYLQTLGVTLAPASSEGSPSGTSITDADREAFLQQFHGQSPFPLAESTSPTPVETATALDQRQYRPPSGPLYNISTVPAAALRGFIGGLRPGGETPFRGYQRGSTLPESVPTFQEQAIESYYQDIARRQPGRDPTAIQRLGGMVPSAVGLAADIVTNPLNLLLGSTSQLSGVQQAGQAVAQSRAGQAVGRFLTKERSFRRPPLDTEALLKIPEAKAAKLPATIKDLYIRERRAQLSQQLAAEGKTIQTATHEAKIELNRLNRETMRHLAEETHRINQQLNTEAYRIALRLKQHDIGPTLTAQSTRYRDLTRSVIGEAEHVRFTPQQLMRALEKRFENDPKAFNLAWDQLKLDLVDEFGQPVTRFFSPQEVLNEIDRIGLTIPRRPTQTYTFADDVADDIRDVLLEEIEKAGQAIGKDFTKIRQAKTEWRQWKPVQKRLVSGTRYFEESETVSEQFVQRLMQYARVDRTMNNEKYFGEIQRYIGYDFARPMQPIVAKLTALERQQVALEAARLAEMERIGLQTQAATQRLQSVAQTGKRSITNLELRWTEQAEHAKRLWGILAKLGLLSGVGAGGVYGVKKLLD